MENLRTFFAIKIPKKTTDVLTEEIGKLKCIAGNSVRWVKPHQLHFTLKFIANFSFRDVDSMRYILTSKMNTVTPFEICINTFGVYPQKNNPRVLWLGIQQNQEIMKTAEIIESACAELGYERENRPFSPHLTIGRVKKSSSSEKTREISLHFNNQVSKFAFRFTATQIYFVQSVFSSKGPRYSDLFSIDF